MLACCHGGQGRQAVQRVPPRGPDPGGQAPRRRPRAIPLGPRDRSAAPVPGQDRRRPAMTIEAEYLETHNWGKAAKFFQALGFELDFATDHYSGLLRGGDGPYV